MHISADQVEETFILHLCCNHWRRNSTLQYITLRFYIVATASSVSGGCNAGGDNLIEDDAWGEERRSSEKEQIVA